MVNRQSARTASGAAAAATVEVSARKTTIALIQLRAHAQPDSDETGFKAKRDKSMVVPFSASAGAGNPGTFAEVSHYPVSRRRAEQESGGDGQELQFRS
jgi:hypothetical protein